MCHIWGGIPLTAASKLCPPVSRYTVHMRRYRVLSLNSIAHPQDYLQCASRKHSLTVILNSIQSPYLWQMLPVLGSKQGGAGNEERI